MGVQSRLLTGQCDLRSCSCDVIAPVLTYYCFKRSEVVGRPLAGRGLAGDLSVGQRDRARAGRRLDRERGARAPRGEKKQDERGEGGGVLHSARAT